MTYQDILSALFITGWLTSFYLWSKLMSSRMHCAGWKRLVVEKNEEIKRLGRVIVDAIK